MNICDGFIFAVFRWAVLLAKLPAFVVREGGWAPPMKSVPGGGDALDLHVKIVNTGRPSSAPLPPHTSLYLRAGLGLKMQSLPHTYIV